MLLPDENTPPARCGLVHAARLLKIIGEERSLGATFAEYRASYGAEGGHIGFASFPYFTSLLTALYVTGQISISQDVLVRDV